MPPVDAAFFTVFLCPFCLVDCMAPKVRYSHSFAAYSLFSVVFLSPSMCVAPKLRSLHFAHPVYVASRYFQQNPPFPPFNTNQRSYTELPCPWAPVSARTRMKTHTRIPRLITTGRDQAGNDASSATVQHRIVATRLSSIVSKLCVLSPGHHLQMLFGTWLETDFRNEVR